ncbi:MAG: helix-turn-helix domain-containing protein [Ktedonobacteraceae bacterium]
MIELLTTEEAAQVLGVCRRTIKRWEDRGGLHPVIATPRTVRYRREDVEAMREKHQRWHHWGTQTA